MDLAADAVAYWRVRPTPAAHWRQYSDYARYDAIAGMYPKRHAIRFAIYGGAAVAWSRGGVLLKLAAVAGAAYAAKPVRRATRLLPPGPKRAAAFAAVPAVMAFTDLAKMAGYLRGLRERERSHGRR
jgi:hypothetical protein